MTHNPSNTSPMITKEILELRRKTELEEGVGKYII